jgi:hypothetical protein
LILFPFLIELKIIRALYKIRNPPIYLDENTIIKAKIEEKRFLFVGLVSNSLVLKT